MKSAVTFIVAYLRELYSKGIPFLVSLFGATLIAVATHMNSGLSQMVFLLAGGVTLIHAIDAAVIRAEAKAKNAFASNLINMLMDGRDVQISVNHGKSEASQ